MEILCDAQTGDVTNRQRSAEEVTLLANRKTAKEEANKMPTSLSPITVPVRAGRVGYSVTKKSKFYFDGHYEVVGTAPNFDFGDPESIVNTPQRGVRLEECGDYVLGGHWTIRNIAGTAVEILRESNHVGDYWNHAGKIIGWTARHSRVGFHLHSYAEYETLSGCHAHDCPFGFYIETGNVALIGCSAAQCYTAFKLFGGGNNGHGVMEGCISNHSVYGIHAENVSLGYSINGFQACGGYPGNTQITLEHINSQAICYNGGQFASADISVDGTSSVYLDGVLLRGPINVTVAPGGVFVAKNCKPFGNFAGKLNGQAWNGNT